MSKSINIDGIQYTTRSATIGCIGCDLSSSVRLCSKVSRKIECSEEEIIWVKKNITESQTNEIEGIIKAINEAGFTLLKTDDGQYNITENFQTR